MCRRHLAALLTTISLLSLLRFAMAHAEDLKVGGTLEVSGVARFTSVEGERLVLGATPPVPCNPALDCKAVAGANDTSLIRVHGDATIEGLLQMGAKTRQMVNLFGTGYGIGIQDFAFYERTGDEFFWYRGGNHSNSHGDPGLGGTQLMHLDKNGDITVAAVTFTEHTKQMVNLFGTGYGIGVQDFAFYERTGNEFYWYKGGDHSDSNGDAGTGGSRLMHLDNRGILTVTQGMVTPVLQITGGADLAEPFKMSRADIPKGAVVSIDDGNAGTLRLSEVAYDKRVAGVVSGANGVNPGISLSQQGVTEGGLNVALSGRVYVLADASSGPIRPGDLLTSSETPGYAMRVTDHARAQGAVIGKSMSSMLGGKGMVLVLVSLQ
jgi:hypothetical protein